MLGMKATSATKASNRACLYSTPVDTTSSTTAAHCATLAAGLRVQGEATSATQHPRGRATPKIPHIALMQANPTTNTSLYSSTHRMCSAKNWSEHRPSEDQPNNGKHQPHSKAHRGATPRFPQGASPPQSSCRDLQPLVVPIRRPT